MPPANDDLINAIRITTDSGTIAGTNVGATAESTEEANLDTGVKTVWYKWTNTGIIDYHLHIYNLIGDSGFVGHGGVEVDILNDLGVPVTNWEGLMVTGSWEDSLGDATHGTTEGTYTVAPGETLYMCVLDWDWEGGEGTFTFDYEFKLPDEGAWSNLTTNNKQFTLLASDGVASDRFGHKVAISGDGSVIAVGAQLDYSGGSYTGGVYVYSGDHYETETLLIASDVASNWLFGISIAINYDGSVIAVGAQGADGYSGAVYVYTGTDWSSEQKISASDAASNDSFGTVALNNNGNILAVGAPGVDSAFSSSGAIYIYSGSSFSTEVKHVPSDPTTAGSVGRSIDISPDARYIIAGAQYVGGVLLGAVYIFKYEAVPFSGLWTQHQKINGHGGDYGSSISISRREYIFVGDSTNSRFYTYNYNSGTGVWGTEAVHNVPYTGAGGSVSADKAENSYVNSVLVGASGYNSLRGAALLYRGSFWGTSALIPPTTHSANDEYGFSVAQARGVTVVGAHGVLSSKGKVYVTANAKPGPVNSSGYNAGVLSPVPYAYDKTRQQLIFPVWWDNTSGVEGTAFQQRTATHIYDSATSTWDEIQTSTPPPFLFYSAGVFDEARDEIFVWGGLHMPLFAYNGGPEIFPYPKDANQFIDGNQNFFWDGTDWEVRISTNYPSNRQAHSLTYDPVREVTVLFGGQDGVSEVNDTWEWDGTDWTEITTVDSPPARSFHSTYYSNGLGGVVIFGGLGSSGTHDAWVYNGTNWVELYSSAAPTVGYDDTISYSVSDGVVVMQPSTSPSPVGRTYVFDETAVAWERLVVETADIPHGASGPFYFVKRNLAFYDTYLDKSVIVAINESALPSPIESETGLWGFTYSPSALESPPFPQPQLGSFWS